MGADAEESLAHDDKHRYVEDEVRGQIMEIQAVVEHEPPDKWVEWKTQSAEEVGKEHYPLMGLGVGMSCPSSGSRCAMPSCKYPDLLSFLTCPFVTEETIHLPPAPDMVEEGRGGKYELGRWSSSVRRWMSKGGRRHG